MKIEEFYFPSDYGRAAWDNENKHFFGGFHLNGYWFIFKKINGVLSFYDESGQDALHIIDQVGEDNIKAEMKDELEFISFLEHLLHNKIKFEFDTSSLNSQIIHSSEFATVSLDKESTYLRITDLKFKNKPHIDLELSFKILDSKEVNQACVNTHILGEVTISNTDTGVFCSNFDEALDSTQKNYISTVVLKYVNTQ